ncbi:MAG: BACON domain-containing protein, partial [Gemmatimonadales bacterium]
LSVNSGTASAAQPSTLIASVNVGALPAPGVYQATIAITAAGSTFVVPVSASVSGPRLLVSLTAVVFVAAEGASPPSPQTVNLVATGQPLTFTIPANPQPWLSAAPPSGSVGTNPLQSASFTLSVNHGGLAPNVYQTVVPVTAVPAGNSPENIVVTLHVVPASTPPTVALSPQGMFFGFVLTGSNPPPQTLNISNNGGGSASFNLARSAPWVAVSPASGNVGQPVQVSVNPVGLGPGAHRATITETGSSQQVEVLLVVASEAPAVRVQDYWSRANEITGGGALCRPQTLELVATSLGNGLSLAVSFPRALLALVVDGCGTVVPNASVVAAVEGANISLQSLGNGLYTGTWVPQRAAAIVPVVFNATHPQFT